MSDCRDGLVQGGPVVVAAAGIGLGDVQRKGGPPDVLELGPDLLGRDPPAGEVVEHLSRSGFPQGSEHGGDLRQHVETIQPRGKSSDPSAQARQAQVGKVATVFGSREPVAQPSQIVAQDVPQDRGG